MGQKLVSRQLMDFNDDFPQSLKKYHYFNPNIHTYLGDYVICDITMPSITQYKGIVLTGYMSFGGNTPSIAFYRTDFIVQISPYDGASGYKITQETALTGLKLQLWSNDSNSNLFRFTIDGQANYKTFSIVFWEHPVNDYFSNPKSIKMGDSGEYLTTMTGWTLRKTGI